MKDKVGRFQQADGGTIFLDEIGDITPALQVRLLRVLQNKEIEKVGSGSPVQVDVRIVAATNRDLKQRVKDGEFREDLFYRLRVIEVPLPSLRERREDIPLLLDHFVGLFNERFGRQIGRVSEEARAMMTSYTWPGNIRELENVVERAFVVCRDETIDTQHLPPELQAGFELDASECVVSVAATDEVQVIRDALEKTGWNKSRAARLLGISRRTIYRKIEEFGVEIPDGYE
jgi:DNA-binding NtrC family response regulator